MDDPKLMQKYELAESQIAKIDVQLKEAAALRKEAKKNIR